MKKTGAWLTVYALERIGVNYTFGIPGVHNTELYDELNQSEKITPLLVTHEQCASFMADAVSRTSDSIGCAVIVPAAGMTHALSGIGEAYLDGIPMMVISGGIRRDTGRAYQLHDLDQIKVVSGITKGAFLIDQHKDVIPTIYRAYELATSGEPGPVFIELAGDVQMFAGEVADLPDYSPGYSVPKPDYDKLREAVALISSCRKPGLYLGWGARNATQHAIELAELLNIPVSTTLQGLSVFPASHPLHTGMGFGPSAVPAARKAFADCDCLIAVGVRFAELATGSYGMEIPENLIHIDINPAVFNRNYPARVAIESDASEALSALSAEFSKLPAPQVGPPTVAAEIKDAKKSFFSGWTARQNPSRVTPGIFFRELRQSLSDDAFLVVDDGNHTFLAAELFPVFQSRHFISPTDFNCMGYSVPAAIGVKLVNPDNEVAAIVGDGAFLMTALEIVTATRNGLGVMFFIFHDGELAQISQFQQVPLNRKTCTTLGEINVEGVAIATGAKYLRMENDSDVVRVIKEAKDTAARGIPSIIDVNIDYSRKSEFTNGVVKVNFGRFPFSQKLRFLARAIKRHTIG